MQKAFICNIAIIILLLFQFGCKNKVSETQENRQSVKNPSSVAGSILGKKYTALNGIADWLTGGEAGFVCQNAGSYNIKIFYHVTDTNKQYLLMSKSGDETGNFLVTDIVEINMANFSAGSILTFKNCKGSDTTETDCQLIAVGNFASGQTAKPEKAWKPNSATGKIEEIPVVNIKCFSENSSEEPF
jgi:hypothetical protein